MAISFVVAIFFEGYNAESEKLDFDPETRLISNWVYSVTITHCGLAIMTFLKTKARERWSVFKLYRKVTPAAILEWEKSSWSLSLNEDKLYWATSTELTEWMIG